VREGDPEYWDHGITEVLVAERRGGASEESIVK
jgi:hypothetical protein